MGVVCWTLLSERLRLINYNSFIEHCCNFYDWFGLIYTLHLFFACCADHVLPNCFQIFLQKFDWDWNWKGSSIENLIFHLLKFQIIFRIQNQCECDNSPLDWTFENDQGRCWYSTMKRLRLSVYCWVKNYSD